MANDRATGSGFSPGSVLLIIEPHSGGHRASYVRWLVRSALGAGIRTVVATSEEKDRTAVMEDVRSLLANPGSFVSTGSLDLSGLPGPLILGRLWNQWRYYSWFKRIHAEVSASLGPVRVIVPYVDYFVDVAGVLGSPFGDAEWVGITMRSWASDGSGVVPELRRRLLRRLGRQRSLRGIFSINSMDTQRRRNVDAAGQLPLRRLVDPAEQPPAPVKELARARLGLAADAFVLLVFGTLDERKGLRHLFAGLDAMAAMLRPVVLLVGKQDEATRSWLRGKIAMRDEASGMLVIDSFVDDQTQGLVFAASDVVWVGYVGHQAMSGVLVLAGTCGLPVIGCSTGEIGQMIRSAGMGITVDVEDPAEVAGAILTLSDPEVRRVHGAAARNAVHEHSPEVFAHAILESFARKA